MNAIFLPLSLCTSRLRSGTREPGGFTLIEMIVATMLLVLGVVAALACFSTGLRATRAAKEYTQVRLLAQLKISELETLTAEEINEGTQQGDFAPRIPDYLWQTRIQKTQMRHLYRAHLTILWGDSWSQKKAEFETLLMPSIASGVSEESESSPSPASP